MYLQQTDVSSADWRHRSSEFLLLRCSHTVLQNVCQHQLYVSKRAVSAVRHKTKSFTIITGLTGNRKVVLTGINPSCNFSYPNFSHFHSFCWHTPVNAILHLGSFYTEEAFLSGHSPVGLHSPFRHARCSLKQLGIMTKTLEVLQLICMHMYINSA